jgi:vesicle transport through interaction with t-SNAREs protein 1
MLSRNPTTSQPAKSQFDTGGGLAVADTSITVFDEELKRALDRGQARLDQLKNNTDPRTLSGRLALCDESMREISTLRKSFNGEFQLLKPADKPPFRAALENFDRRIQQLESQLKADRAYHQKQALVGDKKANKLDTDAEANNVDKMLSATADIQKKTTTTLQRTLKRATETRDMGVEIADTLKGQTDQINRIDQGVAEMDTELKKSTKILMSIARRMATDKVIVACVFLFVAVIVALITVHVMNTPTTATKPPASG